MASSANGRPVLSAVISMPRVGVWHADIGADGGTLEGSVELDVEGVRFAGTAIRSGSSGSRAEAKVVGGAGKLSTILEAKQYTSGPQVGGIIRDILREAGETLSTASEAAVLDARVPTWERTRGPASRALVAVLRAARGTWRVLADGTVWVGRETWPEQRVEHELLDEDWIRGTLEVAPARPDLRPGVTFLGQRISYVIHHLTPTALRTEASVAGAPSDSLGRFLDVMQAEVSSSRVYPARVVSQNGDGTLELMPDDPTVRGKGLDRVPIRHGFPGTVRVSSGARVNLGFEGGDRSKPYACGWHGSSAQEVSIAGGTLPAGRQGDMVLSGGPTTQIILGPGTTGPAPLGTPIPVAWVTAPNLPTPYLSGTVSSGNPTIKL